MNIKIASRKPATLMLADGTMFKGQSIGKQGTTGGEICFNTGMTGYQEIYTDPSYYGQIIVNTTAHIGNYGVKNNEVESARVQIKGLVVRNFSDVYSRHSASTSLQDYLEQAGIIGICGIDTRALVRHIRSKGAMNAVITSELTDEEEIRHVLAQVPDMNGLELSSVVTTKEPYYIGESSAPFRVAVLDLGVKTSIVSNLAIRGCYCKVFPAHTTFSQMQQWEPHGYLISNGPGDPAAMDYAIETVKQVLQANKPLFGICLGHQLLALAVGAQTFKMHHGHRGLNHPVKNLLTGKGEITSQNHGFAVSMESVLENPYIELTHVNLNDNTVEGIRIKGKRAFSVQYHPESSPGPHDSRYLFDYFICLMKESLH
ncbi:MAG: glutamine-hydrolyzing carbamoyl-phosphate synthase small subunit [Cytophagales bacterium]|nr:glutamine-hydrolyzing carbamoyl-phosphate synthase small subunit [Bernardetiaceae bacterium]MDW8209883.1 glutamine-hydrolyzing carbamoyl-phosphate synthase small subunit [Cytophagales bacterium]